MGVPDISIVLAVREEGAARPPKDSVVGIASRPKEMTMRTTPPSRRGLRRHSGAGNYLFIDGHVKTYRPDQITTTLTGAAGDPLAGQKSCNYGAPVLPPPDGEHPWFRL